MIKIYVVLFLMCSCTSIKKDLTHREFIARLNLGQVNGTGNLITYNNKTFFLTNQHVCSPRIKSNLMPIDVLFEKSRSNFVVKLRDLIIDETSDLCLIPVNASKGLDIAKSIQNSSQNIENYFIQYGTINRGLNDRVTVVSGSFSQKETNLALELGMGIVNVYNFDVLSYKMETHFGDSGSLAYNYNGLLVGMVFGNMTIDNQITNGYILPVELIKDFLEKNIK